MRTIWLGKLAVLAGLALFAVSAIAQSQKDGKDQPQFKQIKLTEKQVRGFVSAQKQLAPLASKLESEGDKPDPALQKQIEQIAKSNGFSTLDEFDDVAANISLVLGGLDPQSGQFTEPPDLIKKDIDELKAQWQLERRFTPSMPEQEIDACLAGWQRAVKAAKAWAEAQRQFEAAFGVKRTTDMRALLHSVAATDLGATVRSVEK